MCFGTVGQSTCFAIEAGGKVAMWAGNAARSPCSAPDVLFGTQATLFMAKKYYRISIPLCIRINKTINNPTQNTMETITAAGCQFAFPEAEVWMAVAETGP